MIGKIARQQHILSRRVKGGFNWLKAKTKLNKLYTKKSNTIKDMIHKLTTNIVQNYDEIYIGNVSSLLGLKNKHLARTTADQHWHEIKRQLQYKSEWYDKHYMVVNEKYTSKTCCNCGYINESLTLHIRSWICPTCGVKHDRDINASKNILTVGTTGLAFRKTNKELVD